jgi:hypothetical protein
VSAKLRPGATLYAAAHSGRFVPVRIASVGAEVVGAYWNSRPRLSRFRREWAETWLTTPPADERCPTCGQPLHRSRSSE